MLDVESGASVQDYPRFFLNCQGTDGAEAFILRQRLEKKLEARRFDDDVRVAKEDRLGLHGYRLCKTEVAAGGEAQIGGRLNEMHVREFGADDLHGVIGRRIVDDDDFRVLCRFLERSEATFDRFGRLVRYDNGDKFQYVAFTRPRQLKAVWYRM